MIGRAVSTACRPARGVRAWLGLLGIVSLAAGCFDPDYVSGVTKCSPQGDCPNNWVCRSMVCLDPAFSGLAGAGGGKGGSGGTGGGTGGRGGTLGTGGSSTGAGGSSGTGGAGGNARTCLQGESDPPPSSLITDFADAVPDPGHPGQYAFGGNGGLMGGTATFATGTIGTLSLSGGALTYAATLEAPTSSDMYPNSGVALYVNGTACVNASAYSGVAFTVGVTGTCTVRFMFFDSEHLGSIYDSARGGCAGTGAQCYGSEFAVTPGTTSVAFGATPVVAGQPTAAVDPAKLTAFEWELFIPDGSTAGCTGSFTIDNVRFY